MDERDPGNVAAIDALGQTSRERELTIEDLGAWGGLAGLVESLVDHPLLVPVVHLVCDSFAADTEDVLNSADASGVEGPTPPHIPGGSTQRSAADPAVVSAVSRAICQAILSTRRPALFRDSADRVLASATVLNHCGKQLATQVLPQAPFPPLDSTPPDVLRAADALEIATHLRLAGWADRWDLFVHLASLPGPAPEVYSRAAIRAIAACVDAWTEAVSLVPALERIAGLAPPAADFGAPSDPDAVNDTVKAVQSDAGLTMSRIWVLQALRTANLSEAVDHLDDALRILAPAMAEDDRPDVSIASDVAQLLRDLLTSGHIPDPDLVDRLVANVREHQHFTALPGHWRGDRLAASHAAWSRLVVQLRDAHKELAKPSWYAAPAVIDNIVDLYRTTGSVRAYCRDDDDKAVRNIIAPTLEEGIAAKASLLRHLEDHVHHLRTCVDEGTADAHQVEDLPVAIRLRDEATARFRSDDDPVPKPGAGDPSYPPLTAGSPADRTGTKDVLDAKHRVTSAVAARQGAARFTTGNLVADRLLEQARIGFEASPDYRAEVRDAVDFVTQLLVTFLFTRSGLSESAAGYLYNENADEEDLAKDLQTFVAGSGLLGGVRTEVRRVAGGRVDMEFAFPGFNLYVELKVDKTKVPPSDKRAYLGQTAAYQIADKRLGFLLVLKLARAKKIVAPWLGHALEVVEVADADGELRHVAAFTLAGARTTPSRM
jgi:hypothetical protein